MLYEIIRLCKPCIEHMSGGELREGGCPFDGMPLDIYLKSGQIIKNLAHSGCNRNESTDFREVVAEFIDTECGKYNMTTYVNLVDIVAIKMGTA